MRGHVFRSFWLGPTLSPLERMCIESFLAQGHRFVLYAYDDVASVPDRCELADAREILPETAIFFYKSGFGIGSVAGFSNLFRYKLLRDSGGWWVDTDVLCLRSEIPDAAHVFAVDLRTDFLTTYGTAILKAPKGSELMVRALAHAEELGSNADHAEAGPLLLGRLVPELGLEAQGWSTDDLYPLPWTDALAVFDPGRRAELAASASQGGYFFHLWTTVWRGFNIDATVRPPEGSFLAELYERYSVNFPTDQRYDWDRLLPVVNLQDEHWSLWAEVEGLRHLERLDQHDEPQRELTGRPPSWSDRVGSLTSRLRRSR